MTNEIFTHEGVTYRKVSRKANVDDKVLVVDYYGSDANAGDVQIVDSLGGWADGSMWTKEGAFFDVVGGDEYVVLEPIADSSELSLTETDIRNNPRQVIDLLGNLALRLTQLESKVERLGDTSEQAITSVARNVETWAQEHEALKRKVGEGVKANKLPKPKTFDFAQLSGKTLKIETGYDIADGLVYSTTIGYDEEDGKRYVLDSKITAINYHTGLNAEERREL